MTDISSKDEFARTARAARRAHRVAAMALGWCTVLTAATIGSVVLTGSHDPALQADIRRTVLAILVPGSLTAMIGVPLAWIMAYRGSLAPAGERANSTRPSMPGWLEGGRTLAELSSSGRLLDKDALTGLLSRNALMTFAEDALSCYLRYRHQIAILVLEIDRFRSIGRSHGVEAADQVLRHVADVVDLSIRKTDKAGRLDACRFIVMLREISETDTIALGTRICKAMEDLGVRHVDKILPVTVSVGAAITEDDADIGCLIERAEAALSVARLAGGNRVVMQPATPVPPPLLKVA